MKLGLGIDTGGTYTDAVIYDFEGKNVLAKAKALTTKDNLATGIIESLSSLPEDYFRDIQLVSCPPPWPPMPVWKANFPGAGWILIGYDPELLKSCAPNTVFRKPMR